MTDLRQFSPPHGDHGIVNPVGAPPIPSRLIPG
jgi:hypothetical protein